MATEKEKLAEAINEFETKNNLDDFQRDMSDGVLMYVNPEAGQAMSFTSTSYDSLAELLKKFTPDNPFELK